MASGKSYRQLHDLVVHFGLFAFAVRELDLYFTLLLGREIVGEDGEFPCVFRCGVGVRVDERRAVVLMWCRYLVRSKFRRDPDPPRCRCCLGCFLGGGCVLTCGAG